MGVTEILTIVFVVLKLIGKINWSWWLVLLPEIIAVVLYVALVIYQIRLTNQIHKDAKKLFDDTWKDW